MARHSLCHSCGGGAGSEPHPWAAPTSFSACRRGAQFPGRTGTSSRIVNPLSPHPPVRWPRKSASPSPARSALERGAPRAAPRGFAAVKQRKRPRRRSRRAASPEPFPGSRGSVHRARQLGRRGRIAGEGGEKGQREENAPARPPRAHASHQDKRFNVGRPAGGARSARDLRGWRDGAGGGRRQREG